MTLQSRSTSLMFVLALALVGGCVVVDTPADAGETGDGDGDAGDQCPAPEAIDLVYAPFQLGDPGRDIDTDWTCTVSEADNSDGLLMTLDCPDAAAPVVIDIDATPQLAPVVPVGSALRVHYVVDQRFWGNIYLHIEDADGAHLLTLINASRLLPPAEFAFESPLPNLQTEPGGCALIEDVCGQDERLALTFDGPHSVLDGSYYSFGAEPTTQVWVQQATQLHDNGTCSDVPEAWFRVLVVSG